MLQRYDEDLDAAFEQAHCPDSAPARKDGQTSGRPWPSVGTGGPSARMLAPPHIGVSGGGGSSGIGGGCGSPNAASAADMAP